MNLILFLAFVVTTVISQRLHTGDRTAVVCSVDRSIKIQHCLFSSPSGKVYELVGKTRFEDGRITCLCNETISKWSDVPTIRHTCGLIIEHLVSEDEGDWECILRTQPIRTRNSDLYETVSDRVPIELSPRRRRRPRPSPPPTPLRTPGPTPTLPPKSPLNFEVLAIAHDNQGSRSGMLIRRDEGEVQDQEGDVFYAYEENANPKDSKTYHYDTYYADPLDSKSLRYDTYYA